jgi:hypothetical protein
MKKMATLTTKKNNHHRVETTQSTTADGYAFVTTRHVDADNIGNTGSSVKAFTAPDGSRHMSLTAHGVRVLSDKTVSLPSGTRMRELELIDDRGCRSSVTMFLADEEARS